LYANDAFKVMVRLHEKTAQPFFTANGLRKIEPVKNREFFFGMKNGNIVEGDFVYLHWQLNIEDVILNIRLLQY
jgi:hypothetical protein